MTSRPGSLPSSLRSWCLYVDLRTGIYSGSTPGMPAILGLSARYHDYAAALLIDGEILTATQAEHVSQKKLDRGFPSRVVEYRLREAGPDMGRKKPLSTDPTRDYFVKTFLAGGSPIR